MSIINVLSIFASVTIFKWITISIIVFTIIKRYLASKYAYWEDQGVATGSVDLYTRVRRPMHLWEQKLVQKNGKLFGVYEIFNPVLYLADPQLIQDVLVKDFHIFTNRRNFSTGGDPLIDNLLTVIEDEKWKRIRSIMSPTFSTGKLKKMRPLIDECVNTLVSNFEKISKEGGECDLKRVFGAFSMEVVIQVAFGTKVDALIDENNPIIYNARKMFNRNISPKVFVVLLAPAVARLFKMTIFDSSVTQFFKDFTIKLIEERKKANKNKTEKRYDFLQLMLDALESNDFANLEQDENQENQVDEKYEEHKFVTHKQTLSTEEFVSQCVLFFLAGYDTTATTLSFAAYNLACNQDAQQKLYEEAKLFLESNKMHDYENIHSLKYVDAVLSESLRLFPPAFFLERVASKEYSLGGSGIKIRKGGIVHIPTYALHRDPDQFPDPESFKPERFFPENRTHHPYAYLPFGAGPRSCVGMRLALMEAKLALLHAVYRFKFTPTPNTQHPPELYLAGGLLVPKEVTVKVERR